MHINLTEDCKDMFGYPIYYFAWSELFLEFCTLDQENKVNIQIREGVINPQAFSLKDYIKLLPPQQGDI